MISEFHKQFFREFCDFLNKNKIRHFLVAGSLLGAIRNHNPIDHDSDFDIGIYAEDFEKVKNLILKNNSICIYNVWRREITITKTGSPKSDSQIDIFAIENDKESAYLYSSKSNLFSGIWDIEWRMKFPSYYFNELINYTSFLSNLTIKVPKNYEKILDLEYEDWKNPNSEWSTYDAPAYDKDYRQIAIIIPTFLRDDCVKKLITSIETLYHKDWYRFYIADQGFYTEEKKDYYDSLIKKGHYITYLPFNSGLSYARNYLISKTYEPYIFIVDDDFEFTSETKVQNFVDVLNTKPEIGIVGGNLQGHQEYNFDLIHKDKLYYVHTNTKEYFYSQKSLIKSSIPYSYCDIVLNFALFKREVFKDIQWDNELKMAEHSDFYLRLKKLNKWRVTFTSTVEANHPSKNNSSEYLSFRRKLNGDSGANKFFKKWNLSEDKLIYLREN